MTPLGVERRVTVQRIRSRIDLELCRGMWEPRLWNVQALMAKSGGRGKVLVQPVPYDVMPHIAHGDPPCNRADRGNNDEAYQSDL